MEINYFSEHYINTENCLKTVKQKNQKQERQKIAAERIAELFHQAEENFEKKPELSNRYMELARKLSLKLKVPFSKEQKLQFCKKCSSFLVPGNNCRIRVNKGRIIVLCANCKNIMRYSYK